MVYKPHAIRSLLVCAFLMVAAGQASAAMISIFDTGVDNSGNVLAPGNTDPHYDITVSADAGFAAPGGAIVQSNHPVWLANDAVGSPGSSWISIGPVGTTPIAAGTYTFETTFDLTGLLPGTATIDARVVTDNGLSDVELNGSSLGISGSGFNVWQPAFTINSGFQDGINTLTFIVANAGTNPNPGGLRVDIIGATADAAPVVPEPATALVAALGMAGLIACRRTRCRGLLIVS